jgi:GT2 family glycosyltransferase
VPQATVVIPVYRAESTFARCLEALRRQTFVDFNVVVVDSSPTDSCWRIGAPLLPEATYLRPGGRLLAHEACNLGARESRSPLLVFLDPDVYPSPEWMANLVAARRERGGVVVGGIACYGDRWIDRGAHLAKFDKWLAGGPARRLPDAATANLLIERAVFDQVGPFLSGSAHADTDMSWRLCAGGVPLWLEPKAVVHHHHMHTWRTLLKERYQRGDGYGRLWLEWVRPSRGRLAWMFLISVLPLRLVSQCLRVWRNVRTAGMARRAVATSPVVVTALYAWLIGESGRYLESLLGAK